MQFKVTLEHDISLCFESMKVMQKSGPNFSLLLTKLKLLHASALCEDVECLQIQDCLLKLENLITCIELLMEEQTGKLKKWKNRS